MSASTNKCPGDPVPIRDFKKFHASTQCVAGTFAVAVAVAVVAPVLDMFVDIAVDTRLGSCAVRIAVAEVVGT